jgi:hypothetical protein
MAFDARVRTIRMGALVALGVLSVACGDAAPVPVAPAPLLSPPPDAVDADPELMRRYAHMIPPKPGPSVSSSMPGEQTSVPDGPYVVFAILGGTLVGAGTAGLIGGVVSIVQAATSKGSGSALGLGIGLVDSAPHVLTTGIITLLINSSKHAKAKARAVLAKAPFVLPLPSGGAIGGVGGTF